MPKGDLLLKITDLRLEPVHDKVTVEFTPHASSAGGTAMTARSALDGVATLLVSGIQCRGGPGTLYVVTVDGEHYKPFSFFQMIFEKRENTASEPVLFWADPKAIRDIDAPDFADLPAPLRTLLRDAQMDAPAAEDRDLLEKAGAALYNALGPLRKACLLNIFTKASHKETTDGCFRFVQTLLVCRQDRFFATVDPKMRDALQKSPKFKSASDTLHKPLANYQREDSFKSRDGHANLQVTFMRNLATSELAVDIDIDESAGIEHGFEVIRNAVFKNRTNPYLIREFMLASGDVEVPLDPGYSFVF
jgi:hypothetical protein